MTYRVLINDIYDTFLKAHLDLIKELGGVEHLARTTGNNHWAVLEKNWKSKYNVSPRNSSGSQRWTHLDFSDERAYTMFILRWS